MPPTPSGRVASPAAVSTNWYLLQQGPEVWLVQSDTRPDIQVPRGTKHIVPAFGPGTEEAARRYGQKMVDTMGARWREQR
jgi:hypothetical protein